MYTSATSALRDACPRSGLLLARSGSRERYACGLVSTRNAVRDPRRSAGSDVRAGPTLRTMHT